MKGKLIKKQDKWHVNYVVPAKGAFLVYEIPLHSRDFNFADQMEKEYKDEIESRFNRFPNVEFTCLTDKDENNNIKVVAKLYDNE